MFKGWTHICNMLYSMSSSESYPSWKIQMNIRVSPSCKQLVHSFVRDFALYSMHTSFYILQKQTQRKKIQYKKRKYSYEQCFCNFINIYIITYIQIMFFLLLIWNHNHFVHVSMSHVMFFLLLIWNDNHFIHMWMIFLHSFSQIPWHFFNFVSIIHSDVLIRLLISCEKENEVFLPLVIKILHNDFICWH
jgi:hypothetical protein